jgi:hypothetical protein
VDHQFLHGDIIYDTTSESMMEEKMSWDIPLPINIEAYFMGHNKDISMEVC